MKTKSKEQTHEPLWPRSANITMRAIRRYARQVAERFHPDKIILFGSYAYGTPDQDSDVDLLVVMPTRNQIGQAVRIRMAFEPPPFPMDLIVRTPTRLHRRLAMGDAFLREIVEEGKVLYEKGNAGVG
jgi:predicted nucleotidyltransferase